MVITAVPTSRYICFAAIGLGGLAWDLYSKWWVFTNLGYEHHSSGPLLTGLWGEDVFELLTSLNHGALWGMGQGYAGVFAVLSMFAVVAVLYWLFIHGAAKSWWLTVALALIMGGTLGNLYDRLGLHGCVEFDPVTQTTVPAYAVRDFLHFRIPLVFFTLNGEPYYDWPIFNFADVFLVTGAIMLVIQSFKNDEEQAANSDSSGEKLTGAEPPVPQTGESTPVSAPPSARIVAAVTVWVMGLLPLRQMN